MKTTTSLTYLRTLTAAIGLALNFASFAQTTLPEPETQPQSQPASQPQPAPLTFTVTYDPAIADSFTGRVYVMTTATNTEPRLGPRWFDTEPFFALDVTDWKPNSPLLFDDAAISFPTRITAAFEHPENYVIQAVMRRNLDSPNLDAPDNAYSPTIRQPLNGRTTGNVAVHIDRSPIDEPFVQTERIHYVELRSILLSDFHHRDIIMRAAIILPNRYDAEPARLYPALYWIGGFGSDHHDAPNLLRRWQSTGFEDTIVRVVLDPLCFGGHHVFADSENNGPRARALVEEFIPWLEKNFRIVPAPTARFLAGHSSGGWSSLWLQIAFPDFFGGVWSLAPDPVDFRDFQQVDLYKPGINIYVDEHNRHRPIARRQGLDFMWFPPFAKMEVVMGDGGQLRSFDWVFSPRDPQTGKPAFLFDHVTGAVDTKVAEAWKRYDIRLILESHWPTLGPKLDPTDYAIPSKINVFTGEFDTFYLDGAVKLLKQSLATLNSKATVEIVPGADHGSINSRALRQRIDREIITIFNTNHKEHARPLAYD